MCRLKVYNFSGRIGDPYPKISHWQNERLLDWKTPNMSFRCKCLNFSIDASYRLGRLEFADGRDFDISIGIKNGPHRRVNSYLCRGNNFVAKWKSLLRSRSLGSIRLDSIFPWYDTNNMFLQFFSTGKTRGSSFIRNFFLYNCCVHSRGAPTLTTSAAWRLRASLREYCTL